MRKDSDGLSIRDACIIAKIASSYPFSGSTSFFWISRCVIGCTFHSDEEDVVCDGGLQYVSGASRLMTMTRIDIWGSKS